MFKYAFDNGERIEGNFTVSNGNFSGRGYYYWPNGDIFFGDFVNGDRTGHGIFFWRDTNEVYEGEFRNNDCHGKGYYWYENGDRYEGEFMNGRKHGEGILYKPATNTYIKGRFSNGEIVDGKWCMGKIRKFYEGQILNGVFHGEGTLTDTMSKSYRGTFCNGKFVPNSIQELPRHVVHIDIPESFRNREPTYLLNELPSTCAHPEPLSPPVLPPYEVDPSRCIAKGDGTGPTINVNYPTQLSLYVVDPTGSRCSIQRDDIHVILMTPDEKSAASFFEVSVEEKQGTWFVNYVPRVPGNYLLYLKIKREDISGSPFRITVVGHSGHVPQGHTSTETLVEVDPTQCTARGPGLSRIMVNTPGKFAIILVDTHGNLCSATLGNIGIHFLQNGSSVDHRFDIITDIVKGFHLVQIVGYNTGFFTMYVTVNGKDIIGSPFNLEIYPGSVDPSVCIAKGIRDVAVDHYTKFAVILMDSSRSHIPPDSGVIGIEWVDELGKNVNSQFEIKTENIRGVHLVTYLAQKTGNYLLHVTVDGKNISNSPFNVQVLENPYGGVPVFPQVIFKNKGEKPTISSIEVPKHQDKSEEQKDKSEQQEDKSEEQKDKSVEQENKSEDKSEKQENKSEEDKSEKQENKSEEQEDKSEEQEDKSEEQEDKSEEQENKSEEDKSEEDKSEEQQIQMNENVNVEQATAPEEEVKLDLLT